VIEIDPFYAAYYQRKDFSKKIIPIVMGLLINLALFAVEPYLLKLFYYLIGIVGIKSESALYSNLSLTANIILYVLTFILPALFIYKNAAYKNYTVNLKPSFPRLYFWYFPLTVGGLSLILQYTYSFFNILSLFGIGIYSPEIALPADIGGRILLFILLVIVPAVVEELLFRKVILESLTEYGQLFALLVSSAAFALMHCSPVQIPYAFAGGLIMGFTVLKTRSVVPSMLIHGANNLLSYVYLILETYMPAKVYEMTAIGISLFLRIGFIAAFVILWQKKCFDIKDSTQLAFSPYKKIICVPVLIYVILVLIMSLRWFYII